MGNGQTESIGSQEAGVEINKVFLVGIDTQVGIVETTFVKVGLL